ncbi:MAG: MATE family efflux transporter [Candidatus Limiplasma sp.]|nr:MATE family efflux transporter [Candidatus Limiplasma sp.]
MPKSLTAEEKYRKMMETSIPRLVFNLSIPTITAMLVSSLYNMADTYFVGLLGSASATAGVGVVFPLMALLQAVGFMFGHGSGNHMSRSLGAKDAEDAERMAATGFFSALIAGVVIGALGSLFLEPLAYLLGSTPTIAPHAMNYMLYILLGAPWLVSSLVLNNQLRFQGSAFYSMIGITAGAVLNVLLDPLFIFVLDMGVGGAALATMLSQFVSFVLLLLGTRRGGNICIRFRCFAPTRRNYREILRGGIPSLFRQGLGSIAIMLLNAAAGGFGDAAVAAMSIVTRVMQFMASAVIGFGQGFQPICGFNYGAGRYDRVREAFWFCTKLSAGFLLVVSVLAIVFAPQVIWVFLMDDPEVTRIGAQALRLQCAVLPLFSFVIMSNMMLQTMGLAGKASLMAAARQGLFLIPAVLILPRFMGLLGVQLSQPAADVLSFALALPVTLSVLKELKEGGGRVTPQPEPSQE